MLSVLNEISKPALCVLARMRSALVLCPSIAGRWFNQCVLGRHPEAQRLWASGCVADGDVCDPLSAPCGAPVWIVALFPVRRWGKELFIHPAVMNSWSAVETRLVVEVGGMSSCLQEQPTESRSADHTIHTALNHQILIQYNAQMSREKILLLGGTECHSC